MPDRSQAEHAPPWTNAGEDRYAAPWPLAQLGRRIATGSLHVAKDDNGGGFSFGDGGLPRARLELHGRGTLRRSLISGPLGFFEAYVNGDWDSPDLVALIGLLSANADRDLPASVPAWLRFRRWALPRPRFVAARQIARHYDLDPAFFAIWLDPSLTYSAACFAAPDDDLATAQARKHDRIAELVELVPGRRVLDLGCGWGGFLAHALRRGARPTGVTLSGAQARHCRRHLPSGVTVIEGDYREVEGQFEAIVSVEMLESVGQRGWRPFFRFIAERLVADGHAALQVITIRDGDFDRYRHGTDFIRKHVFPGGILPSRAILRDQVRAAGLLIEHEERAGEDYALTLAAWRARFDAAEPAIARLGFDRRFIRAWRVYLALCEVGFRAGRIDLLRLRLRKPA